MKLLNRKAKGFTLIELIIVSAIFAMIMFGAFALIKPVSMLYQKNVEYENSRASSDIISSYLEGMLRYSDRMYLYNDVADIPDYNSSDTSIKDTAVEYFMKYYYPTELANSTHQLPADVYVMDIYNTPKNAGDPRGKISMTVYKAKSNVYTSVPEHTEWVISEGLYNDYEYNFVYNSLSDITKFELTVNVLKRNNVSGTFEPNGVSKVSTMKLLNMYNDLLNTPKLIRNSNNVMQKPFVVQSDVTDNSNVTHVVTTDGTGNIHIIFTRPTDALTMPTAITQETVTTTTTAATTTTHP